MPLPAPGPDRTCLITGASSGIGAELARVLARLGHGVTLVARREDRLRTLAAELSTATGVRVEVVAADLAEPGARDEVVAEISRRGLTVDVLVNNAGVSTVGPVHASHVEAEMAMIRINVEAVVHLCSALVPGMVERGRGAVLNVASVAAFLPLPGQVGYGASKAFVLSYTQGMAQELRGTGVTVTALCPGPVRTEFAAAAGLTEQQSSESLPEVMWVSASEVATQGVAGCRRGTVVVVPGTLNRVMAGVALHSPRRLLLPLLARRHPALRG